MIVSSENERQMVRLASLQVASYMIRNEAKAVAPIFYGKPPKG
jgi:hypothetical protein